MARRMQQAQLLTADQLATVPAFYSTEKVPLDEKVAVFKLFGGGRWTWYVVEADPETRECFGYIVSGLDPSYDGWGYFSLDEIESVRFPPFGLPAERDLYWTPGPVPEVRR